MTRILAALILLSVAIPCFSQFASTGESPEFKEPETGFAKLIQLKNGGTMYLHVELKGDIEVKLFDASHNQKVSRVLADVLKHGDNIAVPALFESAGKLTLFVSEEVGHIPMLHRVLIDGSSGGVIDNETILEMSRTPTKVERYFLIRNGPNPKFVVRKDPNSDYYAVATLDAYEKDPGKRVQIILYGPDNKEVRRANYVAPNEKFKYMQFLDMAVLGGDQVSVLAYVSASASAGKTDGEAVMANLKSGSKEMMLEELPRGQFDFCSGIVRYNSVSKELLLLVTIDSNMKSKPETKMIFIDPASADVIRTQAIFPKQANEESHVLFGRKDDFEGRPQDVFVNSDGSYTVTFEEIENFVDRYGEAKGGSARLGNIAVCRYDTKGNELECHLIPKMQLMVGVNLETGYHSARRGAAAEMDAGNQYKSFTYINGEKRSYILLNDLAKNGYSVSKGDISTVLVIGDSDGFYFPLDGSAILPDREFVFDKPECSNGHSPGLFSVSDYCRENNTFVTIALAKTRKAKNVKIVWLQPN